MNIFFLFRGCEKCEKFAIELQTKLEFASMLKYFQTRANKEGLSEIPDISTVHLIIRYLPIFIYLGLITDSAKPRCLAT